MRRLLIPLATLLSAFIGSQVSADATGRVFTCHESNESRWQMTQPQAHADAGLFPRWSDCLAWRNGDPGPDYIWSYGQPNTVPTTTTEAPTTTTEATTTTLQASTTTEQPTTTTTETPTTTTLPPPATTTTTVAPSTTYQPTTSAPIPSTTQATAIPIETTTSVVTTTTIPETPTTTVPSDPRIRQAAAVIGGQLAPGVTPQQAQTVLVISMVTTALSTRKNLK